MIQLENVHKHFVKGRETVRALDGISLTIPQGALALVRGPSGCGKTTLTNIAAGLMRPTSGKVTVGGKALETLSPRSRAALRAQRIAVVFQMFHLVPYLTALENILLPTLAARGKDAPTRAQHLLDALDIAHRANHFPSEMSAGERQRCAMARALLNRPDVIMADEPTGNLDDESAQRVMAMLHESRKAGATILLVSHQPVAEIQPDFEFHMKAGRLEI